MHHSSPTQSRGYPNMVTVPFLSHRGDQRIDRDTRQPASTSASRARPSVGIQESLCEAQLANPQTHRFEEPSAQSVPLALTSNAVAASNSSVVSRWSKPSSRSLLAGEQSDALGLQRVIGKADIEESKSNVAMNAWLPQAKHPACPRRLRPPPPRPLKHVADVGACRPVWGELPQKLGNLDLALNLDPKNPQPEP